MCSCDILEKTWRPTKLTLMDRDDIYQSVFARIWVSCKDLDHRDWVAYFLLLATWRQIQGVQLNKQTINPHSKMFFNPLWWACDRDILEKTWRRTKLTLTMTSIKVSNQTNKQTNKNPPPEKISNNCDEHVVVTSSKKHGGRRNWL